MKAKFVALAMLILPLFVLTVNAQWSALNSGYAITTDYHGEDVPPASLVTATAGTTDINVLNVTFEWKDPGENIVFTETKDVLSNGTRWTNSSGSFLIYYANSSYAPGLPLGDWAVQVFFNGPGGHIRGQGSDIIRIRATSFNVVPEVAVVGTAGATIAMLLGLGLFLHKKKKY